MATHKADAKALLDERGYSGPLIRGQNPAHLFEKGVRDRIVESYYWKEQCFGLNAATLCDRAAELTFIGGTYGVMGKPTPFLCLVFKLLQLVPEKEVVLEYLNFCDDVDEENAEEDSERRLNSSHTSVRRPGEFKYLRALAAFYIRLTWDAVDIYQTLEPLLADYRKLKRRTKDGFVLTHMDEFIDDLLTKDRVCSTSLWKLPSRDALEDLEKLEPRISLLEGELEESGEDSSMAEENGTHDRADSVESRDLGSGHASISPTRSESNG